MALPHLLISYHAVQFLGSVYLFAKLTNHYYALVHHKTSFIRNIFADTFWLEDVNWVKTALMHMELMRHTEKYFTPQGSLGIVSSDPPEPLTWDQNALTVLEIAKLSIGFGGKFSGNLYVNESTDNEGMFLSENDDCE